MQAESRGLDLGLGSRNRVEEDEVFGGKEGKGQRDQGVGRAIFGIAMDWARSFV